MNINVHVWKIIKKIILNIILKKKKIKYNLINNKNKNKKYFKLYKIFNMYSLVGKSFQS